MNSISRNNLSRVARILLSPVLVWIGFSAGLSPPVQAETLPPLLPGVEALLTPQGLRRLENDTLPLLLKDLGYDVGQGEVSSWTYQSDAPIRLDSLPAEFVKHKATFQDLRDLIARWLKGFDLQSPRLSLEAEAIHYSSTPLQMGLIKLRPGEDGWILGEAVIRFSDFKISAKSFALRDSANDWLGEVRMNEPVLSFSAQGKEALAASIQFAVRLNRDTRNVEISLVSVSTNFGELPIELSFSELLLPEIRIEVESNSVQDLSVRLRENVLKHQQALISSLQLFLARYARENLPQYLEADLNSRWKRLMDITTDLTAPGTKSDEELAGQPGFRLVSILDQFDWSSGHAGLHMSWETGVVDLESPQKDALIQEFQNRGAADFSNLGATQYDLGVAINPDVLTQAIGLSLQNRTLFEPIELEEEAGNPSVLRLISPPVFQVDLKSSIPVWRARLQFGIGKKNAPLLYRMLFNEAEAVIEAEVLIRAQVRGERSIDFLMTGIELERSRLLESSVRPGILKKGLQRYVRRALQSESKELGANPQLLTTYELSPSYLGIPVQVRRTALSPSGHLLVALDQVKN